MSQLLDLVDARIVAVLESARGSTGLGADAAARYYPSGRLRMSAYAAPLIDPAYPPGLFDRSYEISWTGIGEDPDPQNPLDGSELIACSCDVIIGIAYGKENPQFISTTGTEVATAAATKWRKRALSEIHRAMRALTFPAIFEDTNLSSSGIALIECVRTKGTKSTVQDLGGGRALVTTSLEILLEVPTATSYDP